MVEEIEIVLVIAEPETGDVALFERELCEKGERIAAHCIERGARVKGARCGRLGDPHSRVCLAAKLFNRHRATSLQQKRLRFAGCVCCRDPSATQDRLPVACRAVAVRRWESSRAAKFRFVMPMGLLP